MMKILRPWYHFFLAYLGVIIYGYPSKEIFVLGVTGTKGKSTVLELVNAGLEAAGERTAVSSSLRFKVDKESRPNTTNNTMPGRFFLQKFLREAVSSGCKYALIEITSEGIKQFRHRFIDFDAALIVNLHPEHIEAHGSFERYRDAKVQFFQDVKNFSSKKPKYFFINQDDLQAGYFTKAVEGEKVVFFSQAKLSSPLLGEFNAYNVGAAVALLKTIGVKATLIKKAIANFLGLPGRMEFVQKKPWGVVIDYAHTPDSLVAVYKTIKQKPSKNDHSKMICVLGSCGGGRDRWKRPKIGEIASLYCERIILTNEDPYDEDPMQIIREIRSGVWANKLKATEEILDRGGAIRRALSLAKKGDLVVITGKGNEPYIHIGKGRRLPWSDKGAVSSALQEISRARV